MKIAVLMKDVPDLVEDLELDDAGQGLLVDDLSFIPSEWDDQALEEALLIKEDSGAEVTVIALDTGDVDNMVYTALAKGADHAVKLVGDLSRALPNRARAAILAQYLTSQSYDLILTGVQAVDDLDGQIGGLVAGLMGMPHASVVREVSVLNDGQVSFVQEYSGGKMAEMKGRTPLLLGIQAARKPPRYVTVSRVRQLMKSAEIEEVEVEVPEAPALIVRRLYRPEASGHAEMWEGDVDDVVEAITQLLTEQKLLRS